MPKLYAFKSITMKHNKSFTYKRFRAYLRIQLKNKNFSKKRMYLIIFFYFLISLSVLFLPLDILSKYPFLKYFTDFMDFIPAIKLMETKTYAPELCKFYASYMLVIAIICLILFAREAFLCVAKNFLYPYSAATKAEYKKLSTIKIILLCIVNYIFAFGILYLYFRGSLIGYSRRESTEEHFVDSLFEMILYVDLHQVVVLSYAIAMITMGFVALPEVIFYRRHLYKARRNNGQ